MCSPALMDYLNYGKAAQRKRGMMAMAKLTVDGAIYTNVATIYTACELQDAPQRAQLLEQQGYDGRIYAGYHGRSLFLVVISRRAHPAYRIDDWCGDCVCALADDSGTTGVEFTEILAGPHDFGVGFAG